MLANDIAKINKLLNKHRRPSKFVQTFANIIYSVQATQQGNKTKISIEEQFKSKFPQITLKKELDGVDVSLFTNYDDEEITAEIDEKAEKEIKKNMEKMKNKPILDSNEEIARISQAFHNLGPAVSEKNIFQNIFDNYRELGGERTEDELRQKIVQDILYLVKYKNQKITSP